MKFLSFKDGIVYAALHIIANWLLFNSSTLYQSQNLSEKQEKKMATVLHLEINNHFTVMSDEISHIAFLCSSELLNMVLAQCHNSFPQQTGKPFLLFTCLSGDGRTLAS